MARRDNTMLWLALGGVALVFFMQRRSQVIPSNEPITALGPSGLMPMVNKQIPSLVDLQSSGGQPPSTYAPPLNSPSSGGLTPGGTIPIVAPSPTPTTIISPVISPTRSGAPKFQAIGIHSVNL